MRALLLAAAAALIATPLVAQPIAVPRTPGLPYAPRPIPDRIVLTAGADPAREMAVSFRTDGAQGDAQAQIAVAVDGPTLEREARTIIGTTRPIESANGAANYHQVRFTGLEPGRAYAYRVKGAAGWSEWLQFRTAAADFRPFRFLYLGDTQNGILADASRVIRQGFAAGEIALTVHAGDLVAQRDDLDHDDEWGEWNQAGGYNYSQAPQLPATGNHEYLDVLLPNGKESRQLGPYWPLQFALPGNGAAGVKATTYFVDYQGVRFIILDGTAALDLGKLDAQTRWLDATLAASKAHWNVVLFHQPIFTCARPQDTEELKAAWKPIFDRRRVDLVLQGHDHCYSRLTAEAGSEAGKAGRAKGAAQGPVYLVSVVGSKMYGLNDRARTQPDRTAEATELYQIIDVEADRLKFRTFTASGTLYDGFDLTRGSDGRNRLAEIAEPLPPARTCTGVTGPDGGACVARGK
ncbi:FN3 domain-containing metallophosphoesterase family protein [Sphingobium cupriresistens]|uniref:Metallophosphoesterase family protein n=1 Tax=Sphingobium cupriresistens TaxID=1132417 RepID=A0A8G1ZIZ1_9SPHN|nr:FN3 domain-containing metallophosphoesterase family protein [Sphingobium cupriresistens]RYM14068.1 metallophosphoesterase family protein [Sphingobium cupriresistens]